jgi:hypothetical protein
MSNVVFWPESDGSAAGQAVICCPWCKCSLILHQPDPDLPNRLIATCDGCKSWFLTADPDGTALVPLAGCTDDDVQSRMAW